MNWVLYTLLAAFAGALISVFVIVISWMKQFGSSPVQMQKMRDMIESGELVPSELNQWFTIVCMFGGYLFIRYRIDKHPKIKIENGDNDLPPQ